MDDHFHKHLGDLAAERYGVFTAEEARVLGASKTSLTDRTSRGRYRRVEPGVYAIGGAPYSRRFRLVATVLSFPGLAAISHQSAAELWGMTQRDPGVVEVVTTRWDRVRRPGAVVHESLDLVPGHIAELDGIPVTSPVRTIVDLGASNKWIVEQALEQGIRLGLFSLQEVESMMNSVARRGRRGVGVIRPLLKKRKRWDATTESALEDRFRTLLADLGLPDPQPQYELRTEGGSFIARADFAYPDACVLIELDSEAHHMDRLAFRNDRRKQNRAIALGWTVLRYTWWDLTDEPWRIKAEIEALLGRPEGP